MRLGGGAGREFRLVITLTVFDGGRGGLMGG